MNVLLKSPMDFTSLRQRTALQCSCNIYISDNRKILQLLLPEHALRVFTENPFQEGSFLVWTNRKKILGPDSMPISKK